jgi:hypothetical protein
VSLYSYILNSKAGDYYRTPDQLILRLPGNRYRLCNSNLTNLTARAMFKLMRLL